MVAENLNRTGLSNLSLSNQTLQWGELKNGQNWPQKPWGELYLARQNEGKIPLSCLLVRLYNQARNHFLQQA